MAYMNQEKKAKIAAELKKVVPLDWKYSLAVENHSSLRMTVRSAPIDLGGLNSLTINEFYPENAFEGELLEIIKRIIEALNTGNHNNSDIQTDYFDVGHYVHLQFGAWNKPFVCSSDYPIKVTA